MHLTPVPRIDVANIGDFQAQVAQHAMPVVITGNTDNPVAVATWTLAELASRFGQVKVPVRDYDDENKQFFGEGSGIQRRKMMSLAEYIQLIEVARSRNEDLPYAGNISIRSDPAVASKFADLLAECRFPDWLPGNSRDEFRLWIGAPGQRSTIHNDPYHNFNAQIVGSKRFVLFAPELHDSLYPEFFHAAMWASPIDPDSPDLTRYPKFAEVSGYECDLQEGEILFIPRFWWHYVQALKISVNVNRWVFSDEGRWHQQPEARPFISFPKLLALLENNFKALPEFLQEFGREEFEQQAAEMRALIADAAADAQREPLQEASV